jgi:hypothetical protein
VTSNEGKLSYEIDVPERLVDHVRMYIGDMPELNRLIEGTELSNERITLSIQLWIQSFNNTPPRTIETYKVANFPDHLTLFHGVVIELLKMSGIVQTRNHLNFNDSGATFSVTDKGQEYMGWIQNFMQTHVQQVKSLKIGINAEEGFKYIDSPDGYWPYSGEGL